MSKINIKYKTVNIFKCDYLPFKTLWRKINKRWRPDLQPISLPRRNCRFSSIFQNSFTSNTTLHNANVIFWIYTVFGKPEINHKMDHFFNLQHFSYFVRRVHLSALSCDVWRGKWVVGDGKLSWCIATTFVVSSNSESSKRWSAFGKSSGSIWFVL